MSGTEPGFQLLGTPTFIDGGMVMELPDTVPARLVALLALRGSVVSRHELAGIFYPDESESVARQRIRLQLSRARKLHPGLPLRTSTHYVSCIAWTDVHEFQRQVAEHEWTEAAARQAPELLGSWELPAGLRAELEPLRNKLTEAWLLSIRKHAHELLAQAEHDSAFALLSSAIAQEPLAEDLLQLLLQVAGPAGKGRVAEQMYQDFRELIAPLEPSGVTVRLLNALLTEGGANLPDRDGVLKAAAVLGDYARPEAIAEVVNAPVSGVVAVLSDLEREGLLDVSGKVVVAEDLLQSLTEVEKRYLHGQVARVLSHAGQPLAEGEHWFLAGEFERAAAAWFPATTGLFSREVGRQDEAIALYERILTLPVRSPAWYAASAYYANLQVQLEGTEPALARVEQVLLESTDPTARTFALMVRSTIEQMQGRLVDAAESARLAEIQVRVTDNPVLERDVMLTRIQLLARQGETHTALRLVNDVLERLKLEPPRLALLSNLALQAGLLCDLGNFDEALVSYREQLQLARKLGFRRDEVRVVADMLATLNDMGRAGEEVELGLETLELGEFDVTWPLRFSVAEGLAALGRREEALQQLGLISAGEASTSIKGLALALELRLAWPAGELLERALVFAEETELVQVRVAIAAAVVAVAQPVPLERVRRILRGIGPEKVPAWLADDWQALESLRQPQLIRN